MARKAPTPCNAFGCREVVRGRYCERHAREHKKRMRARMRFPRESSTARGYGAAWRRIRAVKLTHDPFCEYRTHCPGDIATEVDHVDGNNRNNDFGNLKSTCKRCHTEKTNREQGGLGNRRGAPPPVRRS